MNSVSNIAIELATTGDAGNINALLGIFRMPGFVLLPLLVSFFINQISLVYIFISIILACWLSIYIVIKYINNPINPKVRFWSSDS